MRKNQDRGNWYSARPGGTATHKSPSGLLGDECNSLNGKERFFFKESASVKVEEQDGGITGIKVAWNRDVIPGGFGTAGDQGIQGDQAQHFQDKKGQKEMTDSLQWGLKGKKIGEIGRDLSAIEDKLENSEHGQKKWQKGGEGEGDES